MADLTQWQYLFILLGDNNVLPLVSARQFAAQNGNVYFLGDQEQVNSSNRLGDLLSEFRPDLRIQLFNIRTNDWQAINMCVEPVLLAMKLDASVGIDLSSSKGIQALNLYQALSALKNKPDLINFNNQEMTFEITTSEKTVKQIRLMPELTLSLKKILELGEYDLSGYQTTPRLVNTCKAIAQIVESEGDAWSQWIQKLYPGITPSLRDNNPITLPDQPIFDKVKKAISEDTGFSSFESTPLRQLFKSRHELIAWLSADWLEDYALNSLQNIANQCHLSEVYKNVQIGKRQNRFEFNIMFTRGIELIICNCTVASRKNIRMVAKTQLNELHVRSQILAPETTRFCLISTSEYLNEYRQDIEMMAGRKGNKILVLGKKDLYKLDFALQEWLVT